MIGASSGSGPAAAGSREALRAVILKGWNGATRSHPLQKAVAFASFDRFGRKIRRPKEEQSPLPKTAATNAANHSHRLPITDY
jgi:hypothetical protein